LAGGIDATGKTSDRIGREIDYFALVEQDAFVLAGNRSSNGVAFIVDPPRSSFRSAL
jgi:hypothetical protein